MSDEHEFEPVPGLPEPLPEGERILWQGYPRWGALAVRAFHVRKAAIYFGLLLVWRGATALSDGATLVDATLSALTLAPLAAAALMLLGGLAWLSSRSCIYTMTDKRIVMRFGTALPMVVNVPYRIVESAGFKGYRDGTGDLLLKLSGTDRIAYLGLWPHARPWHWARPEPMLRGVGDGEKVAAILSRALAQAHGTAPTLPEAREAARPAVDNNTPVAA